MAISLILNRKEYEVLKIIMNNILTINNENGHIRFTSDIKRFFKLFTF